MKKQQEDQNANHITKLIGKFDSKDIFVCGTGTSLLGFDWSLLNSKITIALNEAVKVKGFIPTFHLFSDANLFKVTKDRMNGSYEVWPYNPKTLIVCQRDVRTNFLKSVKVSKTIKSNVWQFNICNVCASMQKNASDLFVNRTVATGGITLAWKLGAKRIFLLGVDGYKLRIKNSEGVRDIYYYDGSSKPPEKRKERTLSEKAERNGEVLVTQDRHDFWVKQMQELKDYLIKHGNPYPGKYPNAGIYNCSRLSMIDAWEKVDIQRVLSDGTTDI